MKKISIVNSDPTFNDDFIFKEWHAEHLLRGWYDFKIRALKEGFHVSTSDNLNKGIADYVLYNEIPKDNSLLYGRDLPLENEKNKSLLLLLESEIIRPDNYDASLHHNFCKVFTWDDRLIKKDPNKYVKINFSFNKDRKISAVNRRSGFSVCIASNKMVSHDLELYSARKEWINVALKNELRIDLYGNHWGYWKVPSNSSLAFLNRVFRLLPERRSMYPSWRGPAEEKFPVLEQYNFSLCFENARDLPGYITEKIFDSFSALTIPIYRGANNVTDYIPKGCFIDARNFESPIDCLRYASSMPESQLRKTREKIAEFMASTEVAQFTSENFSCQILSTIAEIGGS